MIQPVVTKRFLWPGQDDFLKRVGIVLVACIVQTVDRIPPDVKQLELAVQSVVRIRLTAVRDRAATVFQLIRRFGRVVFITDLFIVLCRNGDLCNIPETSFNSGLDVKLSTFARGPTAGIFSLGCNGLGLFVFKLNIEVRVGADVDHIPLPFILRVGRVRGEIVNVLGRLLNHVVQAQEIFNGYVRGRTETIGIAVFVISHRHCTHVAISAVIITIPGINFLQCVLSQPQYFQVRPLGHLC